jgi:cytochrome c peroxidase
MLGRFLAFFVAAFVFVTPAFPTVVTEEPWHPAAAAYRTMMFMADLVPAPWDEIRKAYEEPHPAAAIQRPARAFFDTLPDDAGAAIAGAIETEDRQRLYEASTRALSRLARNALAEAAASLSEPGQANRKALEAQAYYRAFGSFIEQSDPEAGRRLGLAWLELMSAIGTSGIMGTNTVAAREEDFQYARAEIDTYLTANFEPDAFAERQKLTPLPETIIAARGEVPLAVWLPPGSDLSDQDPLPRLVLNFEEKGIDETDLPLVAFGDMLFDSPNIFGEPARSLGLTCSTCHNRSDINQRFVIPGLSHQPGAVDVRGSFFNPMFNDHRRDSLDIPSLRGLRFTGPYGRDGRFASLRDFTRNVIVSEFAGPEPTDFQLDALIAYMLEFDFLPNSRMDRTGRLTAGASESELRVEALFRKPFPQMDGQSCASCHVPSAAFLDRKAHNIGSRGQGYDGALDGYLDTPTLLGAKYTAPYFHDGSLPTLASVVDWFDTRFELGLDEQERADLTAYLNAVGSADEPYEDFGEPNTQFRLAWEELTTFASTFDALARSRDAANAILMLETVALDLALDATGMLNSSARSQVFELVEILNGMLAAVRADDWVGAETLWASFKEMKEDYDKAMY